MLKCCTLSFAPLFIVLSLRSKSKSPLVLAVMTPFWYLTTSINCSSNLLCQGWWVLGSWVVGCNLLCCFLRTNCYFIDVLFKVLEPKLICILNIWTLRDLYYGRIVSLFLYSKLQATSPNNPNQVRVSSVGSFAAFLCWCLPFEVFGNDDF